MTGCCIFRSKVLKTLGASGESGATVLFAIGPEESSRKWDVIEDITQ